MSDNEATNDKAGTDLAGRVEPLVSCICSTLCHATPLELAIIQQRRHHPVCPLHKTEKHPRLFYYEEAENCWCPAPEKIENILDLSQFMDSGDRIEVEFKRLDMTDEEFYNLEEA